MLEHQSQLNLFEVVGVQIFLQDKIDNLAFAVMHELGHIKNHDNEFCRVNLEDYDHESPEEKAANAFAANALIPDAIWKKIPEVQLYPAQIQRLYTAWAEQNGYNKWIALGRISHETEIGRARVVKECRSRWSPYH